MERLQKIISQSGYCSRRKAEELIKDGKVSVNGVIINELGYKASFNDVIKVEGIILKKEEKVVYLLNKPKNVISSAKDDKDRTTVVDLIDSPYRLYPIGRLDYDSSGLLLLSNDGDLAFELTHPKYEVEKTYEVTIDKIITNEEIAKLSKGVRIDNYISAPAKIKLIRINNNKKTSFLNVSIHEGKNREIRKMFKTINAEVIRLNRIKIVNIELGNLKPGEYRPLKPRELVLLKKYLDGIDD